MADIEKDVVETVDEQEVETTEKQEETVDYESIIAQLREDNARMKRAVDKASGEASNYKKQLRARQTAEEIANEEREEKQRNLETKYNELLREKQLSDLEKEYLASGYDSESAKKSAQAMLDGDHATLFKIQREQADIKVKKAETEWLKSRPEVQHGGSSEKEKDPFILGFERANK